MRTEAEIVADARDKPAPLAEYPGGCPLIACDSRVTAGDS